MQNNSKGRSNRDEVIIASLREELVGPGHAGRELDCSGSIIFASAEDAAGNWIQKENQQEILKILPLNRYGVGVLNTSDVLVTAPCETDTEEESKIALPEDNGDSFSSTRTGGGRHEDDDFDVSTANSRFPSSMAISFFSDLQSADEFSVSIEGGVYRKKEVQIGDAKRQWWLRSELKKVITVPMDWIRKGLRTHQIQLDNEPLLVANGIDLRVDLFVRPVALKGSSSGQLVTVALVNCSVDSSSSDRSTKCVFQSGLSATVRSSGEPLIEPYPSQGSIHSHEESQSNDLLYRKDQVFAVGHGCAADWDAAAGEGKTSVSTVTALSLPEYEVPSVTPDIQLKSGPLSVSMDALSSYTTGGEGERQLNLLVSEYGKWIAVQEARIDSLPSEMLKVTARRHLEICTKAFKRMKQGQEMLDQDPDVLRAFRLMNRAMLLQQKHAPKILREPEIDDYGKVSYGPFPFKENDVLGNWRAFQIGFILMNLASVADEDDAFHETVELIWFPTGGGKTEAYLGLAAFSMLYDRITRGADAEGCQVIMRYTLRLLTAQQLQRAATLICALETLRLEESELGTTCFSVGLWVGRQSTPNTRSQALAFLEKMKKKDADNKFLLARCPWCGAKMGPMGNKGSRETFLGYVKQDDTVKFKCPDRACSFKDGLPVLVIDEDIYANPPSLVIGTVDKFASMPWNSNIRALFGISEEGSRKSRPPALIIQDELHLISGPLGSMVGLYEPLIEELCTDRRTQTPSKPKIIGATATTSRFRDQIEKLYGRSDADLFPPPGLDAEDSFFSKYARDDNDQLLPGKRYVGVCAPGLSSMMTSQVRSFSALLSAGQNLDPNERDPWQTLLIFYNSLRELGGGLTLFQSDIPGYMREIGKRLPPTVTARYVNSVEELTSRLAAEEIPLAIDKLMVSHPLLTDDVLQSAFADAQKLAVGSDVAEDLLKALGDPPLARSLDKLSGFNKLLRTVKRERGSITPTMQQVADSLSGKGVVDACLASSVIEVGVDIDRLGMMAIVGQPKTTSQYIQVSGRVGRLPAKSPGLVVTIYSTAKPRDRSHFEHFREYHQRLYAQVEPSSVTPWSDPALERALHGLVFGYLRQLCPSDLSPDKISESQLRQGWSAFSSTRARFMSPSELQRAQTRFEEIVLLLKERQPSRWGDYFEQNIGEDLMYPMGQQVSREYGGTTFAVPTSMRFVDGESEVRIGSPYAVEKDEF